MKISERGLQLIKHHEGFRNKPYRCVAALWTIGYGHVLYQDQAKIPSTALGMVERKSYSLKPQDNRIWSNEEIDALLKRDLSRFELGVCKMLPNVPLRQGEFDALVSFSFNLGLGTFQRSTLRQKILRNDKKGASQEILKYNKAGGKIVKGLVTRRNDEYQLFLRG